VQAEVGAVLRGAIQQVELERFTLEDGRVFAEKAKEDADKEAFQSMPE